MACKASASNSNMLRSAQPKRAAPPRVLCRVTKAARRVDRELRTARPRSLQTPAKSEGALLSGLRFYADDTKCGPCLLAAETSAGRLQPASDDLWRFGHATSFLARHAEQARPACYCRRIV